MINSKFKDGSITLENFILVKSKKHKGNHQQKAASKKQIPATNEIENKIESEKKYSIIDKELLSQNTAEKKIKP